MPGKNPDDDERELINAEFDSMVAGLNLDQSSPRSYVDELDEIDSAERAALYHLPRKKLGLHGTARNIFSTISQWWNRDKNGGDDSDGARV